MNVIQECICNLKLLTSLQANWVYTSDVLEEMYIVLPDHEPWQMEYTETHFIVFVFSLLFLFKQLHIYAFQLRALVVGKIS